MSAKAKREYLQAIHARYRHARREETQRILDEFCHVTTYHRKDAIRLLNGPAAGHPWSVRLKTRRYGREGLAPVFDWGSST